MKKIDDRKINRSTRWQSINYYNVLGCSDGKVEVIKTKEDKINKISDIKPKSKDIVTLKITEELNSFFGLNVEAFHFDKALS